jgi:homoserine dehydrogenase
VAAATRYNFVPVVVGLATARHGLIYKPGGLDLPMLLALVDSGRPLAEDAGIVRWPTALEGLRTLDADLLVEVTASPAVDGEPGVTHMREALRRGLAVATSNKWRVALQGVELAQLARRSGVAFRAEATVMSGTPLLSTLREGLAGASPSGCRAS